eukprot:symbB.v1.2.013290.t1/scaffold932.1/size150924/2
MAYEAPEDMEGLKRTVELVDKEIDRLITSGIPASKIGVAGMSMGGCLALHVGYGMGRHAGKLGLVGSLSTFLPKDSCLDASASPGPPLFMAHGREDRMILLPWAELTHKRLLAAGVAAEELRVFPELTHDLCPEEVKLLLGFVKQHLKSEAVDGDGDEKKDTMPLL